MTILDISNRSTPQVNQEVYIEGYYQTAREVDGTVRMVSYAYLDVPGIQNYILILFEVRKVLNNYRDWYIFYKFTKV